MSHQDKRLVSYQLFFSLTKIKVMIVPYCRACEEHPDDMMCASWITSGDTASGILLKRGCFSEIVPGQQELLVPIILHQIVGAYLPTGSSPVKPSSVHTDR